MSEKLMTVITAYGLLAAFGLLLWAVYTAEGSPRRKRRRHKHRQANRAIALLCKLLPHRYWPKGGKLECARCCHRITLP